MKRGVMFLLLVLLVIPLASASLSVTEPTRSQYNIGDTIDVSGYILAEEDIAGYLQFAFVCDNSSYPFQSTYIDMNEGDQESFATLSTPSITISSSLTGLCRLKASLIVNQVVVDQEYSSAFEVTTDLNGQFSLDKSQIQLGESLSIEGVVSRLNGDEIDGSAEIYFSNGEEEYLVGFTTIENGILSYEYFFAYGTAEDYNVNVLARDSYGNEQEFAAVDSFEVVDGLYVFVQSNSNTILPGEHVNVFGNVKTITQEYIESGSVEISFNSEIHSTDLSDSQYTYDLWTDSDSPSGEHVITVEVSDSKGNSGSSSVTIEIEAVATDIANTLSNTSFNPEEEVEISVSLFDQAGDFMGGSLVLEVYDSDNDLVASPNLLSGDTYVLMVPQFAEPGLWDVYSYYEELETIQVESETSFRVIEVVDLDYYIENGILYITNTGNVEYTEEISIDVEGEDGVYTISEGKNLDPNETVSLNLADEVPSGSYSLAAPTGFGIRDVIGDITIEEGKPRTAVGWIYTLIALLFIVGLGYLLYVRLGLKDKWTQKKTEKKKVAKKEEDVEVPIKKKKLYDPNKPKPGKKKSVTFENKQKSIDDFKKRTLEEIKRVQAKDKLGSARAQVKSGKLGYVIGRTSDGKVGVPSPK
jgi:hypothetical protein